ncbi:hypothetical protein BC937DRAFT_90834, partial [Endogone sp. FLAS-F59071]
MRNHFSSHPSVRSSLRCSACPSSFPLQPSKRARMISISNVAEHCENFGAAKRSGGSFRKGCGAYVTLIGQPFRVIKAILIFHH